jgi:glycosyltransferase involved in cell wall biosynthesis
LKFKVLHIISGLKGGGAERVLTRLCLNDDKNKVNHIVVSLLDYGTYGEILTKNGITVYTLNAASFQVFLLPLRLFRLIKKENPDVVQTWMYHGDLIGGIVAKIAGIKSIFWNVRQTEITKDSVSYSTRFIFYVCSFLSKFIPKSIIFCAEKAKEYHVKFGYSAKSNFVIHNGLDTSLSLSTVSDGTNFRKKINASDDDIVGGMVGRFDPVKDHENLLNSLSLVKKRGYKIKLILVGREISLQNDLLVHLLKKYELEDDVYLFSHQDDIFSLLNNLDLHFLSSTTEGFPNVLIEAMYAKVPCISTDVGDAKLIVGDTGWIVPPKKPISFSEAIIEAITEINEMPLLFQKRKDLCKIRVQEYFSIEKMIANYHSTWGVSNLSIVK